MLRPLVIVSGDFVRTGGMDRANFALADFAARRGHSVHLVAHRIDDELRRRSTVTFHRVPKPLRSYMISAPLLAAAGKRVARRLNHATDPSQKPIVIVNGGNCDWPDVNWVHYVHAVWEPIAAATLFRRFKIAVAHRLHRHEERRAIGHARLVIANSQRTTRDLIGQVRIPANRVETILYGTDPAIFFPADDAARAAIRQGLNWPPDRPIALFIGALGDRRKGFDTLFAAWQELCRDDAWNVDLAVIGRGAEQAAWEHRVVTAGLQQRVRFLGFRNDVPDLLRAADVLISPTRYEAYGLAVHEALCCGLPAIVSRAGGVAEQMSDALQPLLLNDPESADQLVRTLKHWRDHREPFRPAAVELSNTLRQRTWDTMADEMLTTIESMHP